MSGLIYVGGGYYVGVPARDLTAEEAEQFGRAKLIRSGLYVEPDEPKGKPKPAENKGGQPPQETK